MEEDKEKREVRSISHFSFLPLAGRTSTSEPANQSIDLFGSFSFSLSFGFLFFLLRVS
jgi:hypothetical protein